MATNEDGSRRPPYDPSYRQREVDTTLENHEKRITDNERRWLLAKGGIVVLALSKGSDVLLNAAMSLI